MIKTISEFAKERGVDRGAVNAWLRKHPEVSKACVQKGKEKTIDTLSMEYQLLEKKYPLPQMVEIVEDKESRQKLIKAQELIIQLQEQLNQVTQQAALVATQQLLLEDKEKQLEKAETTIKDREMELSAERTAKEEVQRQLAEAENRIQSLENRSFWQRIFNKT